VQQSNRSCGTVHKHNSKHGAGWVGVTPTHLAVVCVNGALVRCQDVLQAL
jgi:hypothetical protein